MRHSKFNVQLLVYELRNIVGNIFILIFGVIFPILMSILMGTVFLDNVPSSMRSTYMTGVFITMSLIVPLATVFIGYAATFSMELEKKIPLRFRLFGYQEHTLLFTRAVAYLVFMTISWLIYTVVDYCVLDLLVPSVSMVIIFIGSLYLLVVVLLILAHAIALFFQKFSITYAICMILYFGIMILCGMFGVMPSRFPKPFKFAAHLLPMTYISEDFIDVWQGGSYNFAPYIQSFLFFASISCILLLIAIRRNRLRVS